MCVGCEYCTRAYSDFTGKHCESRGRLCQPPLGRPHFSILVVFREIYQIASYPLQFWKVMLSQVSVILFMGRGFWYNHHIETWVPPPPDNRHRTTPPAWILDMGPNPPCYWHLVIITGDLFKLVHLRTTPPPLVRILLECCVVAWN